MITRKTQYNAEREPWVTHELQNGEEWSDFGMDQPNRSFSHVESASRWCTRCSRSLANVRPAPGS